MLTVHEVSELAGVSARTLRYYDKIGLLSPARRGEGGVSHVRRWRPGAPATDPAAARA